MKSLQRLVMFTLALSLAAYMAAAVVVLMGLLGGCCAQMPAPMTAKAIYQRGAEGMVQIIIYHNGIGQGSGMVIGEDKDGNQLVLTAAHCFEGVPHPLMIVVAVGDNPAGYARSPGVLVKADEDDDLALVRLMRRLPRVAVHVARSEPDMFDQVYLVSSPDGAPRLVGPGVLSRKHRIAQAHNHELWQIQGFAWPGSSGGGVLNGRGELVSVIQATNLVDDETALDPVPGEVSAEVIVPDVIFGAPLERIHAFLYGAGVL